jgi:uncharacterized protein YbaR (Trm112 family)
MCNIKTDNFIKKSKEKHGDKYDYSLVEYKTCDTKVKIKCKKDGHGIFEQSPSKHLFGQGCPKCIGRHKTTLVFIQEAKMIHGDKYDYSLVEYKTCDGKIEIKCKKDEHGIFEQQANNHLQGHGCPKCRSDLISKIQRSTSTIFTTQADKIHKGKFDYSLVNYKTNNIPVDIICKKHNITFQQTPDNHMSSKFCCPLCCSELKTTNKNSQSEFIEKATEIHGNRYDYTNVKYKNNNTTVKIFCNTHQEIFEQRPCDHLHWQGCPKCNITKGEQRIINFLQKNNIKYKQQKTFPDLKNKNRYYKFDFYLPDLNCLIEYDGAQHFRPVNFGGISDERALEGHQKVLINDKIKNDYAIKHEIILLRIPYTEFKNIEQILTEEFANEFKNIKSPYLINCHQ